MREYHKIHNIFKRNPETNNKTFLLGQWSLPEFDFLQNNPWIFTEKVDGTNIRVIWNHENKKIKFDGKTDTSQIPIKLFTKLTEMFTIELMEKVFPQTSLCLYGEGYGSGIQTGGKYRKDQSFVLFDVLVGRWWLQRKDIEEISSNLNIDIVPIVGEGTLFDGIDLVKNGFNSKWGNFIAEGIVAKPKVELFSRNGSRIVAKIKYKDFNLKGE